ncbi:MAG: hypothetical protein KF760_05675 [Candidatus Eremiobacteraeota bacterium]|nr:hypothetical protein [Candidatus Eremiobacteraeota bacterium]MCW5870848.1 hypothetical protein [Candidatus Eremiobacteraeota bacterium]
MVMMTVKSTLSLPPVKHQTAVKGTRCTAPKTPALKPGPPKFKAILPARRPLHSNVVMPGKGAARRGKRARCKFKEGHERVRISDSPVLSRLRKILEGKMTPAQALAVIFHSPSVLLNANPSQPSERLASRESMIAASVEGFLLSSN